MRELIIRLSQSSIVHCAGAFLMMASWAYFANSGHPFPKPLYAALVQGTMSTGITLIMKTFLEWLSATLSGLASLIVPPLAAAALSFTLLSTIHHFAGTPEIWLTIAVPFCVATLYAISYTFALWQIKRASNG